MQHSELKANRFGLYNNR